MTERTCRCEATIPAALLDGYACGNPACWRTAEADAAFERFVADLVRRRSAAEGRTGAADETGT